MSQQPSFESAIAELESIINTIEQGKLDLDPSIKAFQRGRELIQYCQSQIATAQAHIQIHQNGENIPLESQDYA